MANLEQERWLGPWALEPPQAMLLGTSTAHWCSPSPSQPPTAAGRGPNGHPLHLAGWEANRTCWTMLDGWWCWIIKESCWMMLKVSTNSLKRLALTLCASCSIFTWNYLHGNYSFARPCASAVRGGSSKPSQLFSRTLAALATYVMTDQNGLRNLTHFLEVLIGKSSIKGDFQQAMFIMFDYQRLPLQMSQALQEMWSHCGLKSNKMHWNA